MNKNTIWKIGTIILAIIIGIVIGYILFNLQNKKENINPSIEHSEEIVSIDGANFTLNDIKNRFLETEYSKSNNCTGNVFENKMYLNCKNEYVFELDDTYLSLTIPQKDSKGIFKYVVDTIETFYGFKEGEYYETLDKFIQKEFIGQNLNYQIKGNDSILRVDLLEPIEKYISKSTVKENEIIARDKENFTYIQGDNKIDETKFIYSNNLDWFILSGKLYGSKNIVINVKLYNRNNEEIYSYEEDLSNYMTNLAYLSFTLNIDAKEIGIQNASVAAYSISLKQK